MARRGKRQGSSGQDERTGIGRFIRDNSLTLTFAALFLLCFAGALLTGFNLYAQEHGAPRLSILAFFETGTFLNALAANWQAAVFQLTCLIVFGVFLVQKGATHSRKSTRNNPDRGGSRLYNWIYRNSLGLAFAFIFLASFGLHVVTGLWAYNEERALTHQPPVSLGPYIVSWKFWFMTFQTWQAEFFAIGVYMVLSIFLRQAGSPESKPLSASNKDTGEANK